MTSDTPAAQGNSESNAAAGRSIALSNLFSYSDADGLSDVVSFNVNCRQQRRELSPMGQRHRPGMSAA
jgi:hypothetical protein